LKFYIDGWAQATISGVTSWAQQTYSLAAGTRTLRWEYTKDFRSAQNLDRGWLDDIAVTNVGAIDQSMKHISIGYAGSGSCPSGTGTSVTFTIMQASCITWQWKTAYRLSVSVTPPAGGTVTAEPLSGDIYYDAGTAVTLTATANAGYGFACWSGDLSGSENPQSLTMDAPKMVTAEFALTPVADFAGAPTSGPAPLTVNFTDLSNPSSEVNSWEWDFDNDGITDSTEQNPAHTYTTAGTYTVRLTVTGPGGSDEQVEADYVTVLGPVTSFVKTWGGADDEFLYAVAVDSGGNVYCGGYTRPFGAGSYDALLLKYDGSRALEWVKTWGGTGKDYLRAVAVDSGGNIYCAGYTESFGAGSWDALLLKYDSSGTLQWARTWGGTREDCLYGVAIDFLGNIYCAGYTNSFNPHAYDDVLLLKYDSSGVLQYAKTWGSYYYDEQAYAVAVDPSGNVYCAGWSLRNVLLLKYDSSGTLQWAKTWGGDGSNVLYAVAVDCLGSIYCAGYTGFGAGYHDALLMKYDSSGALQWAKTLGGAGSDCVYGVAVDSGGSIYCAGSSSSFGTGYWDALLMKYDSSGALQWAKTWGSSSGDYLNAVAVDSTGNPYFVGYTDSRYTGNWQDAATGIQTSPSGIAGSPTWPTVSPSGTQGTPEGTENSPTGSETGGGGYDTLLLF
jgi:uncharacterized delta-60 repeat protein